MRLLAIICGAIPLGVPLASGMVTFLDPLRRANKSARQIRVASLDAVPEDGSPRRFPIVSDRQDAWNHYASEPVGAVFLRRTSDGIEALSVTCPHLGCAVGFDDEAHRFECPCHRSAFDVDGKRIMPSPSPADLTALAVDESRLADGEVWIEVDV